MTWKEIERNYGKNIKKFLLEQQKIVNSSRDQLTYLVKNGIEYLFYLNGWIASENIVSYIRNLEEKYKKTLSIIKPIKNNIVLIKADLGYPTIDTNIDVLVENEKVYNHLIKLLKESGFQKKRKSILFFWHPYNEKYKEMWSHVEFCNVHIHKEVSWRFSIYLDKNTIFSKSIEKDYFGYRFKFPDPKIENTIAIAHILAENREVKASDILQFLLNSYFSESKHFNAKKAFDLVFSNISMNPLPQKLSVYSLLKFRIDKLSVELRNRNFLRILEDTVSYFIDFIAISLDILKSILRRMTL